MELDSTAMAKESIEMTGRGAALRRGAMAKQARVTLRRRSEWHGEGLAKNSSVKAMSRNVGRRKAMAKQSQAWWSHGIAKHRSVKQSNRMA